MLRSEKKGPVLRLTLDRPDVRNALNDDLILALLRAIQEVPDDVRVVVIAGEGKAFCAGGDLEWMKKAAGYTEEENYRDALKIAEMFEAIAKCPAVVIARVQGAAFGGGSGLVCACDIAVASRGSLFAFSEVRLGLVAATISTHVIPKIGHGHTRALFTTGEAFDADHALRIGMVHQVCEPVELDSAIDFKVASILKNGPQAVATSKKLAIEGPYEIDDSARLLAKMRATPEGKEGVAAFLEKRPANFVVEL